MDTCQYIYIYILPCAITCCYPSVHLRKYIPLRVAPYRQSSTEWHHYCYRYNVVICRRFLSCMTTCYFILTYVVEANLTYEHIELHWIIAIYKQMQINKYIYIYVCMYRPISLSMYIYIYIYIVDHGRVLPLVTCELPLTTTRKY